MHESITAVSDKMQHLPKPHKKTRQRNLTLRQISNPSLQRILFKSLKNKPDFTFFTHVILLCVSLSEMYNESTSVKSGIKSASLLHTCFDKRSTVYFRSEKVKTRKSQKVPE